MHIWHSTDDKIIKSLFYLQNFKLYYK